MELIDLATIGFADPGLLSRLEALEADGLDQLKFGVIRMNQAGNVVAYNAFESAATGLAPARVVGRHFFQAVGPCMNNFMVALRFKADPELDATLDYVLTFRMRPTPVRLRLLQSALFPCSYVLIDRS